MNGQLTTSNSFGFSPQTFIQYRVVNAKRGGILSSQDKYIKLRTRLSCLSIIREKTQVPISMHPMLSFNRLKINMTDQNDAFFKAS